jgi:hypothetical protein
MVGLDRIYSASSYASWAAIFMVAKYGFVGYSSYNKGFFKTSVFEKAS